MKNGFSGIRFYRNNIFEIVSTPASFYYGVVNFFNARNIKIHTVFKYLFFISLVLLRLIIRILFLFDDQNLKVICRKNNVYNI